MCSKSQTQLFSFHVFLKKIFSLYSQVFIFRLELFSCFVLTVKKRPSIWGFPLHCRGVRCFLFRLCSEQQKKNRSTHPRENTPEISWKIKLQEHAREAELMWRLRAVTLPLIGPAYKNKSFEHKQKKTRDSYQCETRHWRSEVTETPKILDGHRTDHRASDRKIIDYWLLMEEQEAAQTSDKSASTSQEVPADSNIQNHLKHFSHRNVLKGFKDKQEVMWQNMSL